MILDAKLLMSDAQAMAHTTAATYASTNVVDTGVASSSIGAGEPIFVHCRVGTLFAGSASTTWSFKLQHSASESTGYTDLLTYSATTYTNLTAGKKIFNQALPVTSSRYLKMLYTMAGSATTGGTVDAWLSLEHNDSSI